MVINAHHYGGYGLLMIPNNRETAVHVLSAFHVIGKFNNTENKILQKNSAVKFIYSENITN